LNRCFRVVDSNLSELLTPDYALTENKMDLTLSGTAECQGDKVVLTPNETSQMGSAFITTSISASSSFVVEMTFRITKAAGQDQGADGMAFVCLSQSEQTPKPTVLGEGGAGLGYDGLGEERDWAVEIDTYQTYAVSFYPFCNHALISTLSASISVDRCNDPPAPHISLHSPPKSHHRYCVAVTPPQTLPDVSDGLERTLRIFANAQTGTIQAVLLFTEAGKDEVVPLWEAKLPAGATSIESSTRLLGLTAATGGIAQAVSRCYQYGYHRSNETEITPSQHEVLRFDIWDLSRLKETDA
jgi:peptide-N4-(N-acetyl-beta-glucosaminyl)asparagine amidase